MREGVWTPNWPKVSLPWAGIEPRSFRVACRCDSDELSLSKLIFLARVLFFYILIHLYFPLFANREIVSNALALGEIQSSKFDADLSQHEYTPEAPVTHYARYTRERIK